MPWDLRRRTTDGAPRFTFGAGISLASALACSFAFCGASIGRLACKRFYDFQRSRSKLDADRDCYYRNRVCSSLVVTTVGRLAWRPLFYRRLPAQILGASPARSNTGVFSISLGPVPEAISSRRAVKTRSWCPSHQRFRLPDCPSRAELSRKSLTPNSSVLVS